MQPLRWQADAALTGVDTVLADDPMLTDRSGLRRRRPLLRVVLDSALRMPLDSKMVATAHNDLVIFTVSKEQARIEALQQRGVRVEVPWVDREPAAIMRDHVRLTTQPFDSPPDAKSVADIIDMIGSDKMFLFSSDYPHWQFDGDDAIPPHLPPDLVSRMCADNPLETFPRLSLAA